jgi:hypothetical protein
MYVAASINGSIYSPCLGIYGGCESGGSRL